MAAYISTVNADRLQAFLLSHEADIALSINDFGELLPLFQEIFARDPQS